MILPASTHIVRAGDIKNRSQPLSGTPQPAMVDRCDKMCASVLTIDANSSTTVRHNSEQDAIIFVVSGNATLSVQDGLEDRIQKHELGPGDFAFIPAWTEHRADNDTDAEASWVIFQSGPRPVGAELDDWAGNEINTER